MKRKGLHRPTIEECIELSGIETLHPGGFTLTRRTAEIAGFREGMKVLDVSSGRGTQSIFYAKEYGVHVTGVDLSREMVSAAKSNAEKAGISHMTEFKKGDSQSLPFEDSSFDSVINECAVGIPDDSQKVLSEMIRVLKPGGSIAIHESTWRKRIPDEVKDEISERYGTTPLELNEWITMLKKAGAKDIITEFDQWSKPEYFWKIRKERDVKDPSKVLTLFERVRLVMRIFRGYGISGIVKAFENEKVFYRNIIQGNLGYSLLKGIK